MSRGEMMNLRRVVQPGIFEAEAHAKLQFNGVGHTKEDASGVSARETRIMLSA